jgi:hypothetical protein
MLFHYNYGGGGGGDPVPETNYPEVNTFADLPSAVGHTDIYAVRASSGLWPINRQPAGLYRSNGSVWNWLGDVANEATEVAFTPSGFFSQDTVQAALDAVGTGKENTIATGTNTQFLRGDKSWQVPPNVIAAGASGYMTGADKTKLDGIATGATANATDAQLRDRATHTGTQAPASISFAATARFLGRTSAGGGAGEELTAAQAKAILGYTAADVGAQPSNAKLTDIAGLSFTGNAGQVIKVNAGETAFELAADNDTGGSGGVPDPFTPADGTWNVTGAVTTTGDVTTTAGKLKVSTAGEAGLHLHNSAGGNCIIKFRNTADAASSGIINVNNSTGSMSIQADSVALSDVTAANNYILATAAQVLLKTSNTTRLTLTDTELTSTVPIIVPDEAYDVSGWDGDLSAPSKNAVRDKFETLKTGSTTAIHVGTTAPGSPADGDLWVDTN